jgi:hypothetical protein
MGKHSYCDLNLQKLVKLKIELKKLCEDVDRELIETFGECYEANLEADVSNVDYKEQVEHIELLKKEILLNLKHHNVLLFHNHQTYRINQLSKTFPDVKSDELFNLFIDYLDSDFSTHLSGPRFERAETIKLHEHLIHDLKDIYKKLSD